MHMVCQKGLGQEETPRIAFGVRFSLKLPPAWRALGEALCGTTVNHSVEQPTGRGVPGIVSV